MYSYGIKNTFRPSRLAPNAYGWSSAPAYNRGDVPTGLMDRPAQLTAEQFTQQFAYEWFQSSQSSGLSNPPFASGASGRLHPLLVDGQGRPARILRGYIRRADYDVSDQMSQARLYFMFNPETIERDYVSYMDQSALDPFNTVFQSGNLVAPPSFMDFSFSLFFDRQEEATAQDHPGVFVDYQYFDMVVRNVVPSNPNQSSSTLPDNGVMMVNPRDITVVFSPQISVQGRPLNARIVFEKFTHRMTPIRMRIDLSMRVIYIGPVKGLNEYRRQELQAESSIPFDDMKPTVFDITYSDVEYEARKNTDWFAGLSTVLTNGIAAVGGQGVLAGQGSEAIRKAALDWAKANVIQGQTLYRGPSNGYNGQDRWNLPHSADCSGLVTEAYVRVGAGEAMGWMGHPGTSSILAIARQFPNRQTILPSSQVPPNTLQYGDILIRDGHVAFFDHAVGNTLHIFDASGRSANPQVGARTKNGYGNLTHVIRPTPFGATSSAAQVPGAGVLLGV